MQIQQAKHLFQKRKIRLTVFKVFKDPLIIEKLKFRYMCHGI